MAVRVDIKDGSALEVTAKKWSKTLVAKVTGLTQGTSYAMENEARTASGVPQIGATLGPMKVVSHSVEIEGPTSAKVVIRYESGEGAPQADPENPDLPVYEVGTSTRQENSNFYVNPVSLVKTPFLLNYNGDEIVGSSTIDFAVYTLRASRIETGVQPGVTAKALLNKVNSKFWQGGDPGTWRCVNIQGASIEGALAFRMDYEFEFLAEGHQPIVVAINPSTGEMYPDADIATGNGAQQFNVFGSFDFAKLNL